MVPASRSRRIRSGGLSGSRDEDHGGRAAAERVSVSAAKITLALYATHQYLGKQNGEIP
jgi:hypothetical protein